MPEYTLVQNEITRRRIAWLAKIENAFDLIDLRKVNQQLRIEGSSISTFLTMRLKESTEIRFDHEGWIGILYTDGYKKFAEHVITAGDYPRSKIGGWSIAQIITKTERQPDGSYKYNYDREVHQYSCDRDGDSYMIRLRFFHKAPRWNSDLQLIRLRHLVGDNFVIPDRDVYGLFGSPGIRLSRQPG